MYTSLHILSVTISVIYLLCLPFTLIALAHRDKMDAIDQTEPLWLSFFKIWFIMPMFIIKILTSKF